MRGSQGRSRTRGSGEIGAANTAAIVQRAGDLVGPEASEAELLYGYAEVNSVYLAILYHSGKCGTVTASPRFWHRGPDKAIRGDND